MKNPSQVRKQTAKKLEGKRKCENKSKHPIKTGQRSTKPEASSSKDLNKVEKLLMRLMGPRFFFFLHDLNEKQSYGLNTDPKSQKILSITIS